MKAIIQSVLVLGLIFTQIITAQAATGSEDVSDEIAGINDLITGTLSLESAPLVPNTLYQNGTVYTTWELMHRTPMLAGFAWTGVISNFITPQMYIGTPFSWNGGYMGEFNPFADFFMGEATTYSSCVESESYLSYGLGERIESNDIKELKSIAKACAQEFYGKYFDGRDYTTREEYLMMLFTLFGEDVTFDGRFNADGSYTTIGNGEVTYFKNVKSNYWYAPSINLAYELGMIQSDEENWNIGKEISDTEAIDMLVLYTAYRMDYTGDIFTRGIITTDRLRYSIESPDNGEFTIRVQ